LLCQGVIAGDNSFSIIHIAPTLYGEYCHTASICLDLISQRRDGASGRGNGVMKRGIGDFSRMKKTVGEEKRRKCGSGVLPGSFVNTLQKAVALKSVEL